jgi:hypothetical protein
MTVVEIKDNDGRRRVRCVWFGSDDNGWSQSHDLVVGRDALKMRQKPPKRS